MGLKFVVIFVTALFAGSVAIGAAELQRDGMLIDSVRCAVRIAAYGPGDSLLVTQQRSFDARGRLATRDDKFPNGTHYRRTLSYDTHDSVIAIFDCAVSAQPPETLSFTKVIRDSLGRPLISDVRYGGSRPRDYIEWTYGDSLKVIMRGTGASKTDTSLRMASRQEFRQRPDSFMITSLSYSNSGQKTIVSTIRYGRDTAAVDSVDRFALDTVSREWVIQSRELYKRAPGTLVVNKYVFVNATSRWYPAYYSEFRKDSLLRDTLIISYPLDSLGRRVGSIREEHTVYDAAGHPYRAASGARPDVKKPFTPTWDGTLFVNRFGSLDSCLLVKTDGAALAVFKNDAAGYPVDIQWTTKDAPHVPLSALRRMPPILLPHQADRVPIGYDLNGVRFHIEWKNIPAGAVR